MKSGFAHLAENVKRFRADLDLTQEELGDRCGLTRQAIGKIESGECGQRTGTLDKLAAGLDRTLSELLMDPEAK